LRLRDFVVERITVIKSGVNDRDSNSRVGNTVNGTTVKIWSAGTFQEVVAHLTELMLVCYLMLALF